LKLYRLNFVESIENTNSEMSCNKEKFLIALISTGGTIEKTYSELEGILNNEYRVLDIMLELLQLEGIEIDRIPLMNKDSLQITKDDLRLILETIHYKNGEVDGIVVVHGTDRLSDTAEELYLEIEEGIKTSGRWSEGLKVPIVFTGAMRPYILRNSDALQNLTEALMAVQLVEPGVYVAMHNKIWQFPGVIKDKRKMTFRKE